MLARRFAAALVAAMVGSGIGWLEQFRAGRAGSWRGVARGTDRQSRLPAGAGNGIL